MILLSFNGLQVLCTGTVYIYMLYIHIDIHIV